ncbi:MAG: endonuclease/exonuclease/phosphatase family protein [Hyphomicrobiales bacterium]
MFRGLFLVILGICFAVGAGITVLGLLAPFAPSFEITNHFRPFTVAGFLVLLVAVWLFRARSLMLPVLGFAVVNVALFLLPLSFKASEASSSLAGSRTIKLISFNMWVGDRPLDDIAGFLRAEDADVVLLQEFHAGHAKRLLPGLKDLYPHQLSCAQDRSCLMALLSKTPWTEAAFVKHSTANPALIWARFGTGPRAYRIATLHNAWPFQSDAQALHTDWLIDWRRSVTEQLLIAGDFNLTPFSWKLSKFAWKTGLRRYATYQRTWPGHRYAPAFLIDNIFSTDAFRPIEVRTGPALRSDHLPLIARIAYRAPGG